MTVIEHSPMCPLCKVAHVEEADGQQCTEGRCTGRVSWEATADAYLQQLQGAVNALVEIAGGHPGATCQQIASEALTALGIPPASPSSQAPISTDGGDR